MNRTTNLRTIAGAAVAAAAMLAMVIPGAAHAEEPARSSNNLKQIGLAVHNYEAASDTDGRDFLVWQRQLGSQASIGSGDLADWQSNYGTSAAASGSDVDGSDFLTWQRNLGGSTAGAGGTHEVGHWMGVWH